MNKLLSNTRHEYKLEETLRKIAKLTEESRSTDRDPRDVLRQIGTLARARIKGPRAVVLHVDGQGTEYELYRYSNGSWVVEVRKGEDRVQHVGVRIAEGVLLKSYDGAYSLSIGVIDCLRKAGIAVPARFEPNQEGVDQ